MVLSFQTFFASTALISSLLVITSKNPVISVLFLISVFVNSAVYLMFLGVSFIGISYIIVYVGAIAILFLFILMMINIKLTDILEIGTDYTRNLPLATFIAAIFIFGIFGSFSHFNVFSLQETFINPFMYTLHLFNLLATNGTALFKQVAVEGSLGTSQTLVNLNGIDTNYLLPGQLSLRIPGGALAPMVAMPEVDSALYTFTQVQSLGFDLYTHNGSMLILMSLILLLSMLAPILLSSFYKNNQ